MKPWRLRALVLLLLFMAQPVLAVPVPVGRIGVTLHAGIDPRHPMAAERGGPQRTGRLRGTLPSSETRVLFDVALDGAHPHGPIVDADGVIYVATSNGVLALNRDGEVRYDLRLGPIDVAPALLPSGELLVIGRDRMMSVLSPSGEVRLQVAIAASVRAAPLVLPDGSVLIAALDRGITRYDTSLTEQFRLVLDDGSPTTPSQIDAHRAVVGAGTSLRWIDLERGRVVLQRSLPNRVVGPAIVSEAGVLYQLLVDGTVMAVAGDGGDVWQTALGGRAYEGTAMALAVDGSLRVAIPTIGVVSLGPDGAPQWTFTTDAPFYGTVVVDEEGNGLAVDRRGRLTILDPSGAMRFRVDVGVPVAAAAIAPGRLILATDRPAVMAFELP